MRFKYTDNIDYFITHLLPYLEQFTVENHKSMIELYANDTICELVDIMFGKNIATHTSCNNFELVQMNNLVDLHKYLDDTYDLQSGLKLSKPLRYNGLNHLENITYSCIYPKYVRSDPFNNINSDMIMELRKNTAIQKYDMYIFGSMLDRTNLRVGKPIDNFIDTLAYLKNCDLFITSQSDWKYIALLCNCRNMVVFNDSGFQHHVYNPFNCNILETADLNTPDVYEFINKIMVQK